MLEKLRENPLPKSRGGYGIRIVYELIEVENHSVVIVIGMREDKEVYKTSTKRKNKRNPNLKATHNVNINSGDNKMDM